MTIGTRRLVAGATLDLDGATAARAREAGPGGCSKCAQLRTGRPRARGWTI